MSYKEIDFLVDAFSSMPGISKKTAIKITEFLLKQDKSYITEIISRLVNFRESISVCPNCNNISYINLKCDYCKDPLRNKEQLIIVNNFSDIDKIEKSEVHDGLYFVLGCEVNIRTKDTKLVDDKFIQLEKFIIDNNIKNILIATDLTVAGELTANYLFNLIKKSFNEINVYRLATGMPLNSSLDYIDVDSLKLSIMNKTKM